MDQRDINLLSDRSFRVLVMLWLLASEDPEGAGNLPQIDDIAFRLRMKKTEIDKSLSGLSEFVIHDDIAGISGEYQSDAPETETETEKRRERVDSKYSDEFESFWKSYPRRVGKGSAYTEWKKLGNSRPKLPTLIAAIEAQKKSSSWRDDNGKYIPHPERWLKKTRWEDEVATIGAPAKTVCARCGNGSGILFGRGKNAICERCKERG